MKNLFLFLWRNNFPLLFVVLELISFSFIVKNNNYQNASFLNSSNKVTGTIYEGVNYVTEYINLKSSNDNLARENAHFRAMLPEASYDTALNRTAVNDTNFNQQYSYIVSKVINNSVNRRNNYLTLNKGSLSGVKPEMGVITTNGIVGIIKDVSPHYSTVMSLLHSRSSVSARFKNNNYFGAMIWEDNNDPTTATLSDIPKHIQFKIGDTLVTTAYSTVYPENIFLGTVKSSTIKAGANFYTITIKLSTDFYSLTHVYIVDNLFKKEQQLLEEKFKREQQKLESKSTK